MAHHGVRYFKNGKGKEPDFSMLNGDDLMTKDELEAKKKYKKGSFFSLCLGGTQAGKNLFRFWLVLANNSCIKYICIYCIGIINILLYLYIYFFFLLRHGG